MKLLSHGLRGVGGSMKHSARVSIIATLVILVPSLGTPASGQKAWQRTPYQQWTLADVQNILNDSPWVQTLQKGGMGTSLPLPGSGALRMEAVTIQLRSGLPVRQAIVRLRQIRANYDRLSAAEKLSFDNQAKAVLECPGCRKNYVVTLNPSPEMLKRLSLDALKGYIQIRNERGESRRMVHVELPKSQEGEAVFFFPRFDEKGEPLLTPSSKKLIVLFAPEIFRNDPMGSGRFEFDVSRLILNGEVAF